LIHPFLHITVPLTPRLERDVYPPVRFSLSLFGMSTLPFSFVRCPLRCYASLAVFTLTSCSPPGGSIRKFLQRVPHLGPCPHPGAQKICEASPFRSTPSPSEHRQFVFTSYVPWFIPVGGLAVLLPPSVGIYPDAFCSSVEETQVFYKHSSVLTPPLEGLFRFCCAFRLAVVLTQHTISFSVCPLLVLFHCFFRLSKTHQGVFLFNILRFL